MILHCLPAPCFPGVYLILSAIVHLMWMGCISSIVGALGQLSNLLVKPESNSKGGSGDTKEEKKNLEGFNEELPIVKEVAVDNSVSVSVRQCPETTKYLLYLATDLPGDVIVHWGACRDETRKWEIPAAPHPPETTVFKNKALRTLLQV